MALLLAGCSLAGDVTPPPGVPTLVPAGTALPTAAPIVEPLVPEARPVAFDGGTLYQEHCAPCHGPTGSGGGSMSAQLPAPPPDFANPETLRAKTPQELFTVVTQGRLDRFMPPFADSLTAAERWDAVAYLYTLSAPEGQVAAGRELYATLCAACHGEQGQGDGPESDPAAPPPDLRDHAFAAIRSAADYAAALTTENPAHAQVAAALAEDERWAVVDFARTLAYDYSPPETVRAEGQGTVRGQVVNGTPGASAPAGLMVTLHAFEGSALITTLTTTTTAEGAFAFEAVDFGPERQFVASTEYQGVDYTSAPAAMRPTAGDAPAALDLPLSVYETTGDRSVLAITQAHVFLEFTDPGQATVGVLYTFSNSGDRTLAALADDPLQISLPAGAAGLSVQGGRPNETYFPNEQGFGLAAVVPPGEGTQQVLFSYRLPYDGGLSFAQPMDYPVQVLNLLIADTSVSVTGPALQNEGIQAFQGEQFQNFTHGPLAAGEQMEFTVSGEPGVRTGPETNPLAPSPTLDTRNLATGLGGLALVLMGLGYLLYRRRPAAPQSRDELLQALADLDDDFADGGLPEADYQRERARLKAELVRVWSSEE